MNFTFPFLISNSMLSPDLRFNLWSEVFSRKGSLKRKENSYQEMEGLLLQCDHCQKKFKQKKELNLHKKRHLKLKPFPCQLCEKSFIQAKDLRAHQYIHNGEKPFPCNLCEKYFSRSFDLKIHVMIHT